MKEAMAHLMFISAIAGGGIHGEEEFDKDDISTRVRWEECPGCGKRHKSNKHLYCSKECDPHYKGRKA